MNKISANKNYKENKTKQDDDDDDDDNLRHKGRLISVMHSLTTRIPSERCVAR